MVIESTNVGSLPNETLIVVLSSFSTLDLLPLVTTSRRFHDLILRILHHRLISAAALVNHKLILECYHPANKFSTPYLFCHYLGTDGFSDDVEGEGYIYKDTENCGRLGKLSRLYSHFRPLPPSGDRLVRRLHPAGGWIVGPSDSLAKDHMDYVTQGIHLESHELFSQLCTVANIVKVGPKRGIFSSCVNVGEGITRVWRDWLAERAAACYSNRELHSDTSFKTVEDEEYTKRLLWADPGQRMGLRLRVVDTTDIPPVPGQRAEDAEVFYALHCEELVIKTTQLLLMVEQSIEEEENHSSRAIVFGSWDR